MTQAGDRFPLIGISGGPIGPEMTMDGAPMRGVTGFRLYGSAREVLRLETYQIVRATVAIQAEHSHSVTVVVSAEREEKREGKIVIVGEEEIIRAEADTVWQALADCARQLQLKEEQRAEI